MKTKLLLTVGSLFLLTIVPAYGQEALNVSANVPFQFTVEGKVLPAGQYTFTQQVRDSFVRLAGPDNAGAMAPVITRMAAEIHTTPEDAHVVFDKVGGTYYLSEIWMPGDDGYLLYATKEKHTHYVVNTPR